MLFFWTCISRIFRLHIIRAFSRNIYTLSSIDILTCLFFCISCKLHTNHLIFLDCSLSFDNLVRFVCYFFFQLNFNFNFFSDTKNSIFKNFIKYARERKCDIFFYKYQQQFSSIEYITIFKWFYNNLVEMICKWYCTAA